MWVPHPGPGGLPAALMSVETERSGQSWLCACAFGPWVFSGLLRGTRGRIVAFAIIRGKKRPEGGLRARAAIQAPKSPPSSPLGACGTWGPPPGVATVRNRHGRLLGLQNDPNGGWAARQSPTWWPTTWPHPVPPHSPTAPPGRGKPWGRGLWHTRGDSAAWLGLAGPRGRLRARNRPIWAPGAPGQLPPRAL